MSQKEPITRNELSVKQVKDVRNGKDICKLSCRLKSGWSSRTGPAKSPTAAKANPTGISEAEQAQIRAVLARAEAGRKSEQERIGYFAVFVSP